MQQITRDVTEVHNAHNRWEQRNKQEWMHSESECGRCGF